MDISCSRASAFNDLSFRNLSDLLDLWLLLALSLTRLVALELWHIVVLDYS